MCAATSVFNKLTLRLKDRPIAASTPVLPKAGNKPYAPRFHRSSRSTAACSMRRNAVQCSAALDIAGQSLRTSAEAQFMACLHALPTCTSVSISPPLPRMANIRCRQRRAYTAIGCDCRFAARQAHLMHVRQTCMRTWVAAGGRPGIASHARLCAGGSDIGQRKKLNAGNPSLIMLRDPSFAGGERIWRIFSFSAALTLT
jgi:hypothetical protein